MQNMSSANIVKAFLANPASMYVARSCALQFNDNMLYSAGIPIAFCDQYTHSFVCLYYLPASATLWTQKHLDTFHRECPQAVRLPKLDATLSDTVTFYEAELARFKESPKTHTILSHHYDVAKEYFASTGVRMPLNAAPLPKDYKAPRKLEDVITRGSKNSYEELIYHFSRYPEEAAFCNRLYVKQDTYTLIYSGTTIGRCYPVEELSTILGHTTNKPLFAIRAYDLRPKHQSFIQQLIAHTTPSPANLSRHILVPEVDTPLSDTATMLAKYAQRLEDLAFNVALYQRDTPAPRAVARAYSQLAKSRQNYIDMMHIPDINLPTYTPDATTHAALKKYGAYREET